jgi:hypothetical protein
VNDPRSKDPDRRLQLLRVLQEDNATIDGDVLEIRTDTWAIHGSIPLDGEVMMAEFDTYDEARHVLGEDLGDMRPTSDP